MPAGADWQKAPATDRFDGANAIVLPSRAGADRQVALPCVVDLLPRPAMIAIGEAPATSSYVTADPNDRA